MDMQLSWPPARKTLTLSRWNGSACTPNTSAKSTDSGKCSGTYLQGTINAVRAFQKASGLKQTGVADVNTLKKLYEKELATPEPLSIVAPTPEPGAGMEAEPIPTAAPTAFITIP